MADALTKYRAAIDKIYRTSDREIDAAMADILRRQSEVRVLRPAKDKFRPAPRAALTEGGLK